MTKPVENDSTMRRTLVGCDDDRAQRPAGRVLAEMPWEGRRRPPEELPAESFFRSIN